MLGKSYWRWQAFKLVYILCVIFVLPAALAGFFALYLAIYEPDRLREAVRSKPQQAVDPLESPTYFVREDALRKLNKETPDRARRDVVEKVKKLLRDSNPQVQQLAIEVLGKWGQPEDAAALLELAADRFAFFVRPAICQSLGQLGGEPSIDALVQIMGMGDSERQHALTALHQMQGDIEGALLRRYENTPEPPQRVVLIRALGEFGTTKSLPLLEAALADSDMTVVQAAQQAKATVEKRG